MSLALVGLGPRYSVASGKLPIGTVEAAMLQRVRFDCSFLAILLALTLTTLGLGGCTSGSRPALSTLRVTLQCQHHRVLAAAIHCHWHVPRRQRPGPQQ